MTTSAELVPVEQVDREAAASLLRVIDQPFYADECATGEADMSAAVQAFARHRLAAISLALGEARERAVKAANMCRPYRISENDWPVTQAINHAFRVLKP